MIRRLALGLPPDRRARRLPLRLLAVSDEPAATLADQRNRDNLGRLDGIIGCGDLEPDYLGFLADAFSAPLIYVRGNHDRGGAWTAGREHLPRPLVDRTDRLAGLTVLGLEWPSWRDGRAARDDVSAWRQALAVAWRARIAREQPDIIVSHVPPSGLGDAPLDPYHRGFAAYQWLCRRMQPHLWLHGHTSLAQASGWRSRGGSTTLVNCTGGVLIEMAPVNLSAHGEGEVPLPASTPASDQA